ncbi:DUF2721 domain-containing protein [Methyloterricola oryzae]|uniref:DUF2721 domain-containing protein n=1 Tax=Methyloterricola oryzae TaxID=1495050 RepID=UPI00069CBCF0|nr:DUF2721 domain-containing protein [Methyloterricola oryzae]
MSETIVSNVAHVIQLAVAPVFLLSGIGAMLNVFVNRLSRVVDRARALEAALPELSESARNGAELELQSLTRRASRVNWATFLSVASAILIALIVGVLFAGAVLALDTSILVVVLFVLAMGTLIAGLLCFLGEMHLATKTLHISVKSYRQADRASKADDRGA